MSEILTMPKRFIEEARRRGIDVESLFIDTLAKVLNVDPNEISAARLEIATKYLEEAKEYLAKNDSIQASEKLYKATEECVKVLAEKYSIEEYRKALESSRWQVGLLDKAVVTLFRTLNEPRIMDAWDSAYYLHVQGFHEAKLNIEEVEVRLPKVEWLINYVKERLSIGKQIL